MIAPFRVRSFRFQWPADLAGSWASEMELLILGWYVLVETGSVQLLTVFGSLQYAGTLVAPMFGVAGHRIGNKRLLCILRTSYVAFASVLMALALAGELNAASVLVVAALAGMVRPSDLVMRFALIGETVPPEHLVAAMGMSRTTQDSARIAGALAGAGAVAALGMGWAYTVIVALYALSFVLTLGVAGGRRAAPEGGAAGVRARASPLRDLRDALAHVWTRPQLLAAMYLAFLVNLTAFPLVIGLLPYVAKDVYATDRTGLGYLIASSAFGALLGSLVLSGAAGRAVRPARMMLGSCALWYAMIMLFAQMRTAAGGMVFLALAGLAQGLAMVTMQSMLLRNAGETFRGRVMGIRILAVYGVPIGLMISGPLIERYGYPACAALYCAIGLAFTLFIAVRWRAHLWSVRAAANRR